MWLIRNHAVKCKGIKSTEFYVLRRNYFHTIQYQGSWNAFVGLETDDCAAANAAQQSMPCAMCTNALEI